MPRRSAVERTPVEIWVYILLAITEIDHFNTPFFFVHCTPASYLAFKRTCGDHYNEAFIHPYKAIERTRLSLRLVCKSWKAVADRRHIRGYWMRWKTLRDEIDINRWKDVLRIDVLSTGWKTVDWLKERRVAYVQSGACLAVQRLELLHVRGFIALFSELCHASIALPHLRSLSLHTEETTPNTLSRISEHFPNLIHLTLFSDDPLFSFEIDDVLRLDKLEILFIFFKNFTYQESLWNLPSLQHVHMCPIDSSWESGFLPLLQRHNKTLRTIDLDDTRTTSAGGMITTSVKLIFPVDFWASFPHLELLRCCVTKCTFRNYPNKDNALRFLVGTDPIEGPQDFIATIQPWLEGEEVKVLESIVLFGPYLSGKQHLYDKGAVERLVLRLGNKGIKLMSPAGKLWIEST